MDELSAKLRSLRAALDADSLGAARFRGVDWFAWTTCGGSSVVLLAAETGVAEVLITRTDAWVLTDNIEGDRLREEEVPAGLTIKAWPWTDAKSRDRFVAEAAAGRPVASDRPGPGERPLPESLVRTRWSLLPQELDRYRALGSEAASAMTEVMTAAKPEWTGFELAGAGCEALWGLGIEPTLTLVGGERRLPIFRHATASAEKLGRRAMLVFCGRRHGLFANLTRFVYFKKPSPEEQKLSEDVARIEADAFAACKPGLELGGLYDALAAAYARRGHAGGEAFHHQGGPCGYLSRDAVARPAMRQVLERNNALAINPSLPGTKIEDTVVVREDGLEILTADPRWPTRLIEGRARPEPLLR
jgi:Metallopeptidase family M24